MTLPVPSPPSPIRTGRRDLLACTALCGALAVFTPALAQVRGGTPAPAPAIPKMVTSSEVNAGGGLPVVVVDGATTNVALHAPRTILNWNGFDVVEGETVNFAFDARNWIVLNKIGTLTPPRIDGTITGKVGGAAGGNIWFASPGGMIFGAGSVVDAGSLVVSTASPDSAGFLDPTNLNFSFNGGENFGANTVALSKGAKLTTHGGLLALISPSITSEPETIVSAQGGGSVLYGSAGSSFTLRLAQTQANDFDLVDFIVPNAGSGSTNPLAIDLQGSTNGNSVFVAVVSHTSFASAVINLEGMITAQSAGADGGDIILSGGGGIVARQPGPHVSGGVDTDLYLSVASASRDIQVQNAGQVYGKPWLRPSKKPPVQTAGPDPSDPCGGRQPCGGNGGNGFGNGGGNGFGNGGCIPGMNMGCAPVLILDDKTPFLIAGADATIVSNLTAARDIKLTATANIDLGVARAGRDLSSQSATLMANSLGATGAMTVSTTGGDLKIAAAGLGGNGSFVASRDVSLDALGLVSGATQRVTVQSGRDVVLGSGTFGGGGSVDITATSNVNVDAAQAKLGAVVAGGDAQLRGGALDITSVKANRIVARAESVKIGQATSNTDVYIFATNGDASVGQATAGDDVFVNATNGTASLTSATITGLAPDTVSINFQGNIDAADNGRVVNVTSNQDAKLGLGAGGITGATVVTLSATQDAIVDITGALPGSFSMSAGRDATFKAPTVSFNQVSAGRDLSLVTTVGDFTVANPLVATHSITLGAAGALRVGDVRADSGSITLTGRTVNAGALTAAQDMTLKATGGGVQVASYRAGRDLILQGGSFSLGSALAPVGRDLSITAPADFSITQDLIATRNITFDVQGKATVGNVTAASFQVLAGDFDVTGTITAPTIQIESRAGAFRLGGAASDGAPASGLWLDNAEFGRLRASTSVKLYAGSVAGTVRGDLTVLNLSVNPTFTPLVNLLAGNANNVLVQGAAAPTTSGGAFRIGEGVGVWRPNSILVSGSVGSAAFSGGAYTDVRAFDDVRLHAVNDILMGSQRFISLIQATAVADINVGSGLPTGVAPTGAELNHIFGAAGRLEVSSAGKVVAQNTSTNLTSTVGVLITSKGSPDLIIDPPQIVQLFGAVIDSSGKLVSSFGASGAITVAVVDSSGNTIPTPAGASYTFNTCSVGTSQCTGSALSFDTSGGGAGSSGFGAVSSSAASATLSLSQTAPIASASDGGADKKKDDKSDPASSSDAGSALASPPPPLLAIAPVDLKEIVTDPVTTGTGSEEIWRKSRAKNK